MNDRMTPDQEAILDKIQKLLNLAAKNSNQEESAAAAAKAQELLTRYNLSTSALEARAGGSGRRKEELLETGFYRYQRDVWSAVARLNFCLHWTQKQYVEPAERVRGTKYKTVQRLIGREVNVRSTIAMTNYLLASVERIAHEECERRGIDPNKDQNWVMSFREGMVYRLEQRLSERRQHMIDEQEKAEREAWERASKAGVSHATALTIQTMAQQEADLNRDFAWQRDPGTTARLRAEQAAEARAEEEAYTRWAAANPEEAAAKKRKEQEELEAWRKKHRGRGGRRDDRLKNVDHGAFWKGDEAGKSVGLDPQAQQRRSAGSIGHE